ncbi:MAG TPA: hypothetical protein DCM38_13965, partial [Gammaproteobacteria bacterium]|nr:hypothetical protein [Gammaproteobacteria bacterium]
SKASVERVQTYPHTLVQSLFMTKKSIERISKKRVIKINLEGPNGVQNLFCEGQNFERKSGRSKLFMV